MDDILDGVLVVAEYPGPSVAVFHHGVYGQSGVLEDTGGMPAAVLEFRGGIDDHWDPP